ncbi:MAG: tetratricopeptide repeat protein [Candidatus Promineifilaceae bacterium]
MTESAASFQSLPPEYQRVIQLAQEQHEITITPLQELVGGWSGAAIYLVSVSALDSSRVEHLVMKLDRKRPMAQSDEISRHQVVLDKSPTEFARQHIPEVFYERVEDEHALAIFYAIAGHSLTNFRTLSKHRQQSQLETLFRATNHYLLVEWNAGLAFEQVDHPQALLKRWLGFRLHPGQKIESFLREECQIHPNSRGFIIQGNIFPNPLYYARNPEPWGPVRPGDAIVGLQHSDLNTNNILAKFSPQGDKLEGYYLIDFALFKESMPLLFDQRYLEMSYLVHAISQGSFSSVVELITQLAEHDILDVHQAPIEMVGVNAAIRAGRIAFEGWIRERYPSLHDDLWGQYWLAGAAAGLSYCHKAGQAAEIRLAGLIYAAANLKQYFKLFGLSMPAEATLLYNEGQFGGRVGDGGALASTTRKTPHNLPVAPTNFIGRAAELVEITDLLKRPEARLVTLTGPGGTGKTRLGLETARTIQDNFPHGVYFVDLAPISDPDLLVTTTAHTIGIREGGGRPPLENLKDYLSNKEMFLLFDNFEQITGAASVVAELLASSPGISVLVTSRIPLQLRGEFEYPVSPLSLPPDASEILDETLEYEAVALFRQQAKAINPHFEITEDNSAAVIEICRRLDGLPLAIEIAAARIKMLPPQALLTRLDQSLKLLVGGAKDLPSRQQTLRRTIDWSYDLLEPAEQILFTRLGIFAGGFTLEAAEGVCNPSGELDVFSGIEILLNNSLLRQVKSVGDEPRFDILQTVRDYAREKGEEAGIVADLRRAHCFYYAQLAGSGMGAGVFGAQSVFWLQRLDEEHDNFRAALLWAEQHEEGIPLASAMMTQLTWFWYRYGHLQEGSEWTERILEVTNELGDSPVRALALVVRAYLALWIGDLILAVQRARESVELCQRLNFDEGLSMAKLCYGTALINQGRDKEAYPHLVEAVELYDQQDQPWMKGTTLVHLANVSLGLDVPNQAIQWLDMATPFLEESGDIWCMAFGLSNYGEVARTQGDYEKAEEYYRRTEELYEQADARGDQARLVNTIGYIAQHKGNYQEAQSLFQESLSDFLELGNHRGIAECLAGLAGLAAEQGKYEWAAPLLGAAESQLNAIGGAWWPADRVEIERARKHMQSALEEEFETLLAQGRAMGFEEAVAYASASE